MLWITSQVSVAAAGVTCGVSFVRDEEAAGSNPATPTRSQGMQPAADRLAAGAEYLNEWLSVRVRPARAPVRRDSTM